MIINKNTTQAPISTGLLGAESVVFIYAPRVYVKAADSINASPYPVDYSNGSTPPGWTDLGVIEGNVKVNVEKVPAKVVTGIDQYMRAAYAKEKLGTLDMKFSQLDDVVFSEVSGLVPVEVLAGSEYSYAVGSEDLHPLAVLLVCQNKTNGKEIQFYNPAALFNFAIEESEDGLLVSCKAYLPFFTVVGDSKERFLQTTLFTTFHDPTLDMIGDSTLTSLGDLTLVEF